MDSFATCDGKHSCWTKGNMSETLKSGSVLREWNMSPLLSVPSDLGLLGVSLEPHDRKTLGVGLSVASWSCCFIGRLHVVQPKYFGLI